MSRLALIALAALLPLAGCAMAPPPRPVSYIDAHSHILSDRTLAAQIELMRGAGLDGAVIMTPDPAMIAELGAARGPFTIPFISIARTPDMSGIRLGAGSAAAMASLYTAGSVCGFGEIPTRLEPNPDPDDATAIGNAFRTFIYAKAETLGAPVNVHVDIGDPATAAAVERMLAAHPKLRLVLAHGGWSASAELMDRLLSRYPNLYADLSVRLDPPGGWAAPGTDGPPVPQPISILQVDGALKPEWRSTIERHSERFLFGLDITNSARGRAGHIGELMASARGALSRLPRPVEEAIAHGNLQRLLEDCLCNR